MWQQLQQECNVCCVSDSLRANRGHSMKRQCQQYTVQCQLSYLTAIIHSEGYQSLIFIIFTHSVGDQPLIFYLSTLFSSSLDWINKILNRPGYPIWLYLLFPCKVLLITTSVWTKSHDILLVITSRAKLTHQDSSSENIEWCEPRESIQRPPNTNFYISIHLTIPYSLWRQELTATKIAYNVLHLDSQKLVISNFRVNVVISLSNCTYHHIYWVGKFCWFTL